MSFGICYILPNQQIFRKHIIYSLLTNAFAGRIWPGGRSLVTPKLDSRTYNFDKVVLAK